MSEASLRDYLKQVEMYLKGGLAKEHGYRPALHSLLKAIHPHITPVNDPKHVEGVGAPDFIITSDTADGTFTVGYIETKDVGVSLDKTEQGEQMGRYKRGLENLLLTDYLEFRWYVKGERQAVARLATPRPDKSLIIDKAQLATVDDILRNFLGRPVEQIRNPADLARRMARLTHMIRDTTVNVFERKSASETLDGLYKTFKEVLLPDLSVPQFADMFAQTLAYGLFAARYNHKKATPFNRQDAANEIPRTNPFLRRLFGSIAGPDFDDEPFIGFVNELSQVLAFTDMNAVLADFGKRTRQEDPIVHFYETFLAQYDPKLRELRGVYYTPEPVVSYIVRSVDALLRDEFDCPDGLADNSMIARSYEDEQGKTHVEKMHRVLLLDPACGTGTFSYSIIDSIRETYRRTGNAGMWSGYVREHLLPRLFGFELLMAPYAVAHLKLGMQLAALDLPPSERANWAYDFNSDERLGIYLTNTLEEALKRANVMLGRFISDEANEAARVKKDYPVMVIVGNPPYSGHSANNGDWIKHLLHGADGSGKKTGNYFEVDGQPLGERNPKYLNDDYVKFLRFAQWRIEQTGYGILAFITNHGYLDNPTFRGMRQSLLKTFDDIYVLDLHGNSKKKERTPDGSKDDNVFDIQQGVAIGIFVKKRQKPSMSSMANVHHAYLWGPREVYEKVGQGQHLIDGKYYWLNEHDLKTTEWKRLEPQTPYYLFKPQDIASKEEYESGWKVTNILPVNSTGVKTHRDHFVVDFDDKSLRKRLEDFRNLTIPTEAIAEQYGLQDTRDWKLSARRQSLSANADWSQFLVHCLYRPFDVRAYFHHDDVVELPRHEVMHHLIAGNNIGLATTRAVEIGRGWEHILCANEIIQNHTVSLKETNYLFPLYLYPDPKQKSLLDTDEPTNAPGGRRPNLAPQFIKEMEGKLGMRFVSDGKGDLRETFGPEDVFDYMYAVFHSPTYRARYAEFLKIDFPRLPLTSDVELFRALCGLSERLVKLHLMESYGSLTPSYPVKGNDMVERVEYLVPKDAKDGQQGQVGRVYINKTQYFEGVPSEVWNFSVGGYQVCHKWLKDRKNRVLSFADVQHYQRIVGALAETIALMERVDEAIEERGGWPFV